MDWKAGDAAIVMRRLRSPNQFSTLWHRNGIDQLVSSPPAGETKVTSNPTMVRWLMYGIDIGTHPLRLERQRSAHDRIP